MSHVGAWDLDGPCVPVSDIGVDVNPLDLPVHPILVHLPLAMLTAAWVCLVCRYGLRDQRWGERAKTFETIGVATLPITIIAGFVDTRGFEFATNVRWDQPLVWNAIVSIVAAGGLRGPLVVAPHGPVPFDPCCGAAVMPERAPGLR